MLYQKHDDEFDILSVIDSCNDYYHLEGAVRYTELWLQSHQDVRSFACDLIIAALENKYREIMQADLNFNPF